MRRYDAWFAVIAGMLLVAWDVSGVDIVVTRWFGGPGGFPWRDSFWTSGLLHQGGRIAAWAVVALLVTDALRPLVSGPSRAERWRALAATLGCMLLVPALKRFSATSCPWDLAEFGGTARYVPHWWLGQTDGGPGHCFPSGHAVAAFGFLSIYFLLRRERPRAARLALVVVCTAGALFGAAQLARGAHYVSHTLWSAWLCWVVLAGLLGGRRRPVASPNSSIEGA